MNSKMVSYFGGQIQEEILVATMEGHENGKTLCWKPSSLVEGKMMRLGWNGLNWKNDPCYMLWIPTWIGVVRISGRITLLVLLISYVISTPIVWIAKAHWQKPLNMHPKRVLPFASPLIYLFPWKRFFLSHLQLVFL